MSIRNPKREELRRLESNTLDAQFKTTIQEGLNCSPFEAEAVLGVVREVYFPFMEPSAATVPPGKITLVAVCADEPAGKPVSDCEKRSVCLTVHRRIEDDRLMQTKGPAAYRQARIVDLCQEAMSQGALLTREDLAYRVFFVNVRTISRDLEALRQANPEVPIPLRSTVHDIGPVLTHRVRIVRLALEGLTTTEIQRRARHSVSAITNYVSTLTRCAQLARRDMQAGQITFLLRRSRKLVEEYIDLLHECESDKNMAYHLEELLRLGHVSGEKTEEDAVAINPKLDRVRKMFGSLREKNLKNALAHVIGRDFPRIGGDRIRVLCAEMILEVVAAQLRPREHLRHGQALWLGVDVNDPPARGKRIADTHLIPMILDLSTDEDIQARLDRTPAEERLRIKAIRLCEQAYHQGALLSNADLAELMTGDATRIAECCLDCLLLLSVKEAWRRIFVMNRRELYDEFLRRTARFPFGDMEVRLIEA